MWETFQWPRKQATLLDYEYSVLLLFCVCVRVLKFQQKQTISDACSHVAIAIPFRSTSTQSPVHQPSFSLLKKKKKRKENYICLLQAFTKFWL